jgi:hypothetical protein
MVWWDKVGPHFRTWSERTTRSKSKDPVHEGCRMYYWCYHAIEAVGFVNLSNMALRQQSTWKSRRASLTENKATSRTLMAQDRKLIGILTGAMLDCRPQPRRTSPALRWFWMIVKPTGTGGGGAERWLHSWTFEVILLKFMSKQPFLTCCKK